MSNIPLHPERGLDLHLTSCPKCGGDAEELTLGALRKAEVTKGQYVYANVGKTSRTAQDLIRNKVIDYASQLHWEPVEENERVPASQPCKACMDEMEEHAAVVKEGGVYFKCLECSRTGVLKANSQLSIDIRSHAGIHAPDPIGFEHEGCSKGGIVFPCCEVADACKNNQKEEG